MYFGMSKLKRTAASNLDQPDKLVSLIFEYADSGLRPIQIEQELAELVRDVQKLSPATVLEIGTAGGGTLFLWTRLARENATIVSVDLPSGQFGGGYSKRRARIYQRFAGKQQKLHLLREDSHAQSTFNQVRAIFGEIPIDMLFIDGDHTYRGAKKDWEMYSSLVRPGGLIAFHDIAKDYDDTQVKSLWDSIKAGFEHHEYAVHPEGLYGIGVLYK